MRCAGEPFWAKEHCGRVFECKEETLLFSVACGSRLQEDWYPASLKIGKKVLTAPKHQHVLNTKRAFAAAEANGKTNRVAMPRSRLPDLALGSPRFFASMTTSGDMRWEYLIYALGITSQTALGSPSAGGEWLLEDISAPSAPSVLGDGTYPRGFHAVSVLRPGNRGLFDHTGPCFFEMVLHGAEFRTLGALLQQDSLFPPRTLR